MTNITLYNMVVKLQKENTELKEKIVKLNKTIKDYEIFFTSHFER